METMVATVLIVIIFTVASLVMNAQVKAITQGNTMPVETQLHRLEYEVLHGKIPLPHGDTWEEWRLDITEEKGLIMLRAVHQKSGRKVERQIATTK